MEKYLYYTPTEIEHPGVILEEKLQEMDMTIKELAARSEKPEKSLIDIIQGQCSITPDMALAIEYVTGMPAEVLLNWQQRYDEAKSREKMVHKLGRVKTWLSTLPLKEMIDKGWVEAREQVGEQVDTVLRFFGVVSPKAWEDYYFNQRLKVAFRISLEKTSDPYAIAAWLRRGEIQAMDTFLEERYDPKRLKERLPEISHLLLSPPDDIVDRLTDILAETGIKLLFTEPLSGVPIKGATRWIYGSPCIQLLSERQEYENFRFTVLHEIGHILLHGKKDIFLEEAGFKPDDDLAYERKEKEADAFARKMMTV